MISKTSSVVLSNPVILNVGGTREELWTKEEETKWRNQVEEQNLALKRKSVRRVQTDARPFAKINLTH